MSDLHPCTACGRHVRIDETACPFCAAALEPGVARRVPRGRFTRAAVFAGALVGAAACGGGGTTGADEANPPISDAGVVNDMDDDHDEMGDDDDAVGYDDDDMDDDDLHPVDMPYGAPPARTRLV